MGEILRAVGQASHGTSRRGARPGEGPPPTTNRHKSLPVPAWTALRVSPGAPPRLRLRGRPASSA